MKEIDAAIEALEQHGCAYLHHEKEYQAAIAGLRSLKQEPALGYATRLATAIYEQRYRQDAPDWKPLPDLLGVLTQIDNMTAGLVRPAPESKQEPVAWAVQGCSRMWSGEFAEFDARTEAGRCGGTCYAYPLYTRPVPEAKRISELEVALNKYSEDETLCKWDTRIAELEAQNAQLLEALKRIINDNSYYFPAGNPWGDRARAAIAQADHIASVSKKVS